MTVGDLKRAPKHKRCAGKWLGIGRSVGVLVDGDGITAAKWRDGVDHDESAVGLIYDYAKENGLTIRVELPLVLPLSPCPPAPKTAREFFQKYNIDASEDEINEFQKSMELRK